MGTLQPTKQNDMVAINNNYKVLKNEHTSSEVENTQMHSQIRIHNQHLRTLLKLTNTKKEKN